MIEIIAEMSHTRKVLIIAPHPDDEVLGCGGAIKKLTSQNNEVWILIMTRGKEGMYSEQRILNVRQEAINAHKLLNVSGTRFLDFPAPDLDLVSVSELSLAISEEIKIILPDTIFLPFRGDLHHDHKAVFNAGLVAARPLKNSTIKNIYSFETLSETEWAAPFSDNAFIPDFFINISDTFETKLKAMKCYKSQLRQFPNPRSLKSIEALANLRGSTVGFTHAEAFKIIRVIED
jgi:N-acetylglucosamine malate deacetylase 1